MNKNPVNLLTMLAFSVFCHLVQAAEHASEALEHTTQAASSAGDSKAVAEHATEALKHVEAAKAEATNPSVVKHLNQSETDLKSALKNAERFNTGEAAREAQDAKAHLDAIDK